jgi:hypothetical protein
MFGNYLLVIHNVTSAELLHILFDALIEEVSKRYRRGIGGVTRQDSPQLLLAMRN